MIRTLFLAVMGAALLQAQPVSYGVKLGTTLNNSVETTPSTTSLPSRLSGGPFVELHLPLLFSVEFSALYRSSSENATRVFPLGPTLNPYLFMSTDKIRTWDLPLLLKYRFSAGKFRPFVGAGGAWSLRSNHFESLSSCLGPQDSCRPSEYPNDFRRGILKSTLTRFGPAASAGFDIKMKHMTIAPEVRWNRVFSGGRTREQFSILVGFGFGR
jgi:hypothetical protein